MIADTCLDQAVELEKRFNAAQKIADQAAELALQHFANRNALDIDTKRHPQDVVSEADKAVEQKICSLISESFPEDAQLGEEFGYVEGLTGYTWVIDPIDGTAPFLNGLPGWCVCIAVTDKDGPAIGIIDVPVLGERFAAMRGKGTTLNGLPVRVTDRFNLQTGMLGVGANDRVTPKQIGKMFEDLMSAGVSYTRYGSGALMLAWVAAGRLVGYVEPLMSAWDCMAAYCLIEEAGGKVLPFPTTENPSAPYPVLGAAPQVYDEVMKITQITQFAEQA
ncbi:inositol monophosphatase [Pseudovibrio sp. Tun.PSC04-5.I4]|uniref:inositol monophosphatase family protein n=1 Tax=Pseudovibrio sp. Tun.PSC04-5.I4 TaxID=1798213 RepID=UPI00088D477C|nr:inositol monophosphatase [Pseudovibrio sp. Tun.PSC04-5.I4]SDQ21117.1 myo-inositol-1(or 4)-monophosphatase [Pseudovibrio sp. Tun.PSC04-5.I4]